MANPSLDDGLTEYERQRLAHVARNREYMARLGIQALAGEIAGPSDPKPTKRAPRAKVKREPAVGERRSARVRNMVPEFDGAAVDALSDDEDVGSSAKRRKVDPDSDPPASPRAPPASACGRARTPPWKPPASGSRMPASSCSRASPPRTWPARRS